jgi:S-formylglutathione hydrolase FrmB
MLIASSIAAGALVGTPASASELRVTARTQLSPRLSELTMTTPAFDFPVRVRVLVPDGYAADPSSRRYPVLYLLHGSFDTSASWTDKGAAERITAGLPLIVVMPAMTGKGNAGGWASDWRNEGRGGVPKWETFMIDQLIPWTDANLRTLPERGKRAVAGLSMGGFSAMSFAARHPDLFVAAASFSGAVDTNDPEVAPIVEGETLADGGATPDAIWGPRASDALYWRAHNPWDLAGNLRGMTLSIRTGNGHGDDGSFDAIEAAVHDMSVSLHQRLDALGIPHVWDDYGNGTHSWPYWQRDLGLELPRIMEAFGRPPPPPDPFTYTSAEPAFSVYGWRVEMHRPAAELATLADASSRGFTLRGSGSATVTTPPVFAPGEEHGVAGGAAARRVRSDGEGRLRLEVPLGPGNPVQQYVLPAAATQIFSTRVTIACVAGARWRVALPRSVRARWVYLYLRGHRLARVRAPGGSVAVDPGPRAAGRYRVTVVVRGTRAGRGVRLVWHRTFTVCAP